MKRILKGLWLRRLFSGTSKDLLIRCFSLLLAVILWYFVGGENRIDKNVMVPVEVINLPQNLVISNQYKKEIEVSVSGPRTIIADMDKGVVRQVDLSKADPGTLVVNNSFDTISVPRGVTVKRVQPSSIILSLDRLIEKKVPILVRTIGRVESGYYLKSKSTRPRTILITGPETILQKVDKIFTRPVNITGMTQSGKFQAPLELSSQLVDLIGETSITVEFDIRPEGIPTTIENIAVEATLDGEKVPVTPAVVRVVALVPKVLLAERQDPVSLVKVVAHGKSNDKKLQVIVESQQKGDMPIEIVSVTPDMVEVLDGDSVPIRDEVPPLLHRSKQKEKK